MLGLNIRKNGLYQYRDFIWEIFDKYNIMKLHPHVISIGNYVICLGWLLMRKTDIMKIWKYSCKTYGLPSRKKPTPEGDLFHIGKKTQKLSPDEQQWHFRLWHTLHPKMTETLEFLPTPGALATYWIVLLFKNVWNLKDFAIHLVIS